MKLSRWELQMHVERLGRDVHALNEKHRVFPHGFDEWSEYQCLRRRVATLEDALAARCAKCKQKLPPPKGHGRA